MRVTTGGVTVALTVTTSGASRTGGGTGFMVTRNKLEPSAVCEYVLWLRKLTGAAKAMMPRLAKPGRPSVCVALACLRLTYILISISASVNW